jgi:hypothetical protein
MGHSFSSEMDEDRGNGPNYQVSCEFNYQLIIERARESGCSLTMRDSFSSEMDEDRGNRPDYQVSSIS